MIYLLLSILFNAVLFVIVKLFAKFNIDALQALVVNYFVAFLVGLFFLDTSIVPNEIMNENWFKGSILLGFVFISTFYATTLTSQRNGLSVASVASKMSVIIPISLGVILYNEHLGFIKIIGIALALIAVYFTSKKETGEVQQASNLLYPILVFFGAGTIDASLKYLQTFHVPSNQIGLFSSVTFFCAFSVGILTILFLTLRGKIQFSGRNILGGIALGLPNYFSLYFLVKMLEAKAFESATLFTIHNISIVLVSTFVGILFFKEKISIRNAFGIGLALFALYLVTY
ncbi:EamA-like transporter family protein [Flavobacterium aquaticum]|uniref:EamA-like transporter family protein n=1 Tax=Flavobacterium aquaticum TaxID=1236486 RepID=A0A327YGV8_9FLAO|nr:DMT family transporter [Flavobacterium aquaticum]RAK20210.1 EamA-like transporter family protein [Flavobacterium aquaticum]